MQQPYTKVPTGGNPRQTEAWALTEAARRIKESSEASPFDEEVFLQAVRLNWRLWTIFQAEISSPDCPLPQEIRDNMLSLSNYIDKVSVELISDPKPENAATLVTINREIAMGLFETPKEAPAQDAPSDDGAAPPPASGSIDASA